MAPQPPRRRHDFLGRNVAGRREHDIRLLCAATTGPFPYRSATRRVLFRCVDVEPLQLGLLVNDDQVDVIAAAQAMVRHRQETVRVRWQVHARHRSALREDDVDEAGALVTEAIVIVAPAG